MTKNYYDILGVSKDASADQIKKAYRDNVRKYHPDSAPEDKKAEFEAILTDINRAYDTLSDPEKRRGYDTYGENAEQMQGGMSGGMSGEDIFSQFGGFSGMFEMFGMFGNKKPNGPVHINETIKISLEMVYTGGTVKHNIKRSNYCSKCAGTGNKNKKTSKCSTCGGKGQMIMRRGNQIISATCSSCGGKGNGTIKQEERCIDCKGIGSTTTSHELSIFVKKGINNFEVISILDQGNEDKNGKRSNVYIRVKIMSHNVFKRNVLTGSGRQQEINPLNLSTNITISLAEALCGFKKTISHLDGHTIDIVSKKTIYQGDVFIIPNEGLINSSKKGDLYVKFNIVKSTITDEQKNKIYTILTGSSRPILPNSTLGNEVQADKLRLLSDKEMSEIESRNAAPDIDDDF